MGERYIGVVGNLEDFNEYPVSLNTIRDALAVHGLILRGGLHPGPDDDLPPETTTLLLIGNVGPAMWRAFEAARPSGENPLNQWTRCVLSAIADRFGACVIYPFDGPPYAPFMSWAKRAEAVQDSPLGMLIHPQFGLWHAWRGALAFAHRLDLPTIDRTPSPCIDCAGRPCLNNCPVGAFRKRGYDVVACAAHLRTPEGADCMAEGCLARRACPVGRDYLYEPAQAALHMAAFLRDRPK
jgi:ferredoxin